MLFEFVSVVVMDPIEAIKPAKDSTLAILLAAQAAAGLFYAEQKDSTCATASPSAASHRSRSLTIRRFGSRAARRHPSDWATMTNLDAEGPTVRYRVHLQHLHIGSRPNPRRAGVQSASGPARHELKRCTRRGFGMLRPDLDIARHARHERVPARTRQGGLQAAGRHGAARSSCSNKATRTATWCSRH